MVIGSADASRAQKQICVQLTCLDLLTRGYDVHVLVDGVSSQRENDRQVALDVRGVWRRARRAERSRDRSQRMVHAGALLTTAESAVFELLGDAKDAAFKDVLRVVKERNKEPSLLSRL